MQARQRIIVHLDADTEPISGRVSSDGGSEGHEFAGFLELIAAMDAARARPPEAGTPPSEARGEGKRDG
jgi:hypothetical protein